MKSIRQYLDECHHPVFVVDENATVYVALEIMSYHNVGALPVVVGPTLVGIFSERDYARKVALRSKSAKDTLVSEVMTKQVITIHLDVSISQCMDIMTKNRIRHLPIMNEKELIGIISIGDVVSEMIALQNSMIDQLKTYITS